MQTRDYGWMFGALLIAALGGALVGVLFAPRRGKKTRKMLSKQAATYRDQARGLYVGSAGDVDDAIDKGKSAAKRTSRKLKTDAGSLKEQVAATVSAAR